MSLALVIVACAIASTVTGCATSGGPRQIDALSRRVPPPESNWSRVGRLAPASEISVTMKGSRPGTRYFVSVNDAALVVLNLTHPALQGNSARTLRDMAANHPEYFVAMQRAGTFGQGNVRVGRDGLFVADRRIADLDQVVETIARDDVSEIRGPVVARGSVAGTLVGGWLGFAVGVVPGLGGAPQGVAWLAFIGATACGGYLGFHWSGHETEGIVYRAP